MRLVALFVFEKKLVVYAWEEATLHIAHRTKSRKSCDVLHIALNRKNRHFFLTCCLAKRQGQKNSHFYLAWTVDSKWQQVALN